MSVSELGTLFCGIRTSEIDTGTPWRDEAPSSILNGICREQHFSCTKTLNIWIAFSANIKNEAFLGQGRREEGGAREQRGVTERRRRR